MKVEFEGSLADIKSEMQEFLENGGAEGAKAGGKTSSKKNTKVDVINADTLRELMLSIADKDGKKKVLSDYGVSKISEIDAEQIEAVYNDMKKLS